MSDAIMQMIGLGTMCLAAGIGIGAVGLRLIETIASPDRQQAYNSKEEE